MTVIQYIKSILNDAFIRPKLGFKCDPELQ